MCNAALDNVRRQLQRAIDENNATSIKVALQDYADVCQQVSMQVTARELLSKLLEGKLDEGLTSKLRQLANKSQIPSKRELVEDEIKRYYDIAISDPNSSLTACEAHLSKLRVLLEH